MKKEIKSIQNNQEIKKESEESSPATASSNIPVSNNSGKKFNPRWGKPVIVYASQKESGKKFNPQGGKPVIINSPVSEKRVSATPSLYTPTLEQGLEKNNQASFRAPIPEKTMPALTPSSPAPDQNVVHPVAVKGSNNKMFVGVLMAAVILLGALIGYWAFQIKKSDQVTEPAVPQEAVVAKSAVPEEDIRNLVTKWLASWKSGDMRIYRSFYTSDFQSKGKNLDAWISHKTNVSKKSKNINITIDNLQITADENNATVVFTQHYSSSITKDSGKKTLEMKKINDEWKIYREVM